MNDWYISLNVKASSWGTSRAISLDMVIIISTSWGSMVQEKGTHGVWHVDLPHEWELLLPFLMLTCSAALSPIMSRLFLGWMPSSMVTQQTLQ